MVAYVHSVVLFSIHCVIEFMYSNVGISENLQHDVSVAGSFVFVRFGHVQFPRCAIIGFALLIPPLRQALIRWFIRRSDIQMQSQQGPAKGRHHDPYTIEGEYRRDDD